MPDMLVKLYDLPDSVDCAAIINDPAVKIKRAMICDKAQILNFVKANFSEGWVSECEKAILNSPPTCYIAVREKEVIGFACYDATAPDFFGPIGVLESARGKNVGRALTLRCLLSMREKGYGYAIIGWVGPAEFYKKTVGATVIEDSAPGVYRDLIRN